MTSLLEIRCMQVCGFVVQNVGLSDFTFEKWMNVFNSDKFVVRDVWNVKDQIIDFMTLLEISLFKLKSKYTD